MKKTFCAVLMLCVTVLGIFAQSADQRSGVIRELTGEVELKFPGASAFVPALPGSEVTQDTIVSTGFKSTAIIAVGSSVITVWPLTRLSLAEIQISSGTENMNMDLQTGRIRVDVKPPAGIKTNFTVQSPIATASVRGTSFEFDTRRLKVIEGKLSFQGKRGMAAPVSAGRESFVGKEKKVIDPLTISSESLLPRPPVGSEPGGGTTAAASATGDIIFTLDFQ